MCNLLAQRIILSCRFIAIEKSEKAELTSSLAYNILREWQRKKKTNAKLEKCISTLGIIKNALSSLNAIIYRISSGFLFVFQSQIYLKDLEGYCFSCFFFFFFKLSVAFELHIPLIACTTLICRLPRSRNPIWD